MDRKLRLDKRPSVAHHEGDVWSRGSAPGRNVSLDIGHRRAEPPQPTRDLLIEDGPAEVVLERGRRGLAKFTRWNDDAV